MSITKDGTHIVCDGFNCKQSVRAPIGLGSVLGNPVKPTGWLYVNRGSNCLHYCAQCSRMIIHVMQNGEVPGGHAANGSSREGGASTG